jgi:acetolactate synthase-1/2/3 large subunit
LPGRGQTAYQASRIVWEFRVQPQAGTATSTAEAYLAILRNRGVEYLFANAGTDFAPIVEGYAKASITGTATPTPITATHENLALSMAHGYAVVSGKLPAVMVHVSVGTANGVCAIMNAARENVPMLFTAGRTPLFEDDTLGSRDSFIHWGQEMFDQAGMLRELVKWDYELRSGAQVEAVVDRAINIAMTEPRGPVYLSLPREVLAAPMEPANRKRRPVAALPSRPSEAGVAEAARLLAAARNPLIIAGNTGRDTAAVDLLAELAMRFALPVVQNRARHLALPSSHPMHLGYESGRTSARPTWSWCSNATCRGFPRLCASNRNAGSSMSDSIRCSAAFRSAASRATSRSAAAPPPSCAILA